jgi:hypothetical protein
MNRPGVAFDEREVFDCSGSELAETAWSIDEVELKIKYAYRRDVRAVTFSDYRCGPAIKPRTEQYSEDWYHANKTNTVNWQFLMQYQSAFPALRDGVYSSPP